MSDKPEPKYSGPEPLQLPKTTRPPDYSPPTETPSGLHRVLETVADDMTKAKRSRRYQLYSVIGTVLIGVLGGGKYVQAQGESQDTKNERVKNTLDQHAKDIARLDAGQAETAKRVNKVERKVDRVELLIEMELDQHGISKSKRPPKVEDDE